MSPRTNSGIPLSRFYCSFAPRIPTFRTNRSLGRFSRGLMRLGVGGCLNFDFGRGIAKLALELISGLLEFPKALANTTGELGKLFCAEEQHHNDKNEDSFRPAGLLRAIGRLTKARYSGFLALQSTEPSRR